MIDKKPIEELIADCKKYLPAYPVITKTSDGTHFVHWGMSLRDYFAGQALLALISKTPLLTRVTYSDGTVTGHDEADRRMQIEGISATSYEYANAMIAEREK